MIPQHWTILSISAEGWPRSLATLFCFSQAPMVLSSFLYIQIWHVLQCFNVGGSLTSLARELLLGFTEKTFLSSQCACIIPHSGPTPSCVFDCAFKLGHDDLVPRFSNVKEANWTEVVWVKCRQECEYEREEKCTSGCVNQGGILARARTQCDQSFVVAIT